jgi:signal transduction histidine kinase/HAMP domain-containing protein
LALSFWPSKHSIGAKVFGAFLAMGLITATLGGFGLYVLAAAGHLVVDTYDRPLMAINFARSASLTFALMDKDVLQRKFAPDAERAAIEADLEQRSPSFFDDLAVAEQRSLSQDERVVIQDIRGLVQQWNAVRLGGGKDGVAGDAALAALAKRVIGRFDVLVELLADHSFIGRRKAVWQISYLASISMAMTLVGLLLSAAITLLLTRQIIRPLSTAAGVADRIASGELDTPIPAGGKDETGKLLHSMTVMQDSIRAMMQRETAQRQSAQGRLIDALESSREGMVLVDAGRKIVIANSQVATFFSTAAPFIVEGTDFDAAVAHIRPRLVQPVDIDAVMRTQSDRRHIAGSQPEGEFQLVDGRWIRFSRSDTQDGGFFLFLSDFTDIKEREEHFKEAKRQAEAASNAKSNFLAHMSHELRTPLNAIIGFSEIMAGQLFGKLENKQYLEYAGSILKSGRHLLDIISSVLDLAKSEAGKLELKPEPVDLREVIEDCGGMLREQCERAHLVLDIARSREKLPVYGEPAKLRQIVLNLLSNAVKFTEAGGKVTVFARPDERGGVELRIVDTGIGMSPDEIPIALAPFGQVDSRLARRYEGAGLGLPLTKALVELHGGVMAIESERGKGTIVMVALPPVHTAYREIALSAQAAGD